MANLVFYILFVYLSNPGKYQGQISQGNSEKPVAFPRIEVLLMQKNLIALFTVVVSILYRVVTVILIYFLKKNCYFNAYVAVCQWRQFRGPLRSKNIFLIFLKDVTFFVLSRHRVTFYFQFITRLTGFWLWGYLEKK